MKLKSYHSTFYFNELLKNLNIKNPKQGQKERLRRWKGEIKRREKEKKSVEEIEEVKKKKKNRQRL